MDLGWARPCDSSCESVSESTSLGSYPLCMVGSVNMVFNTIQGLAEYNPAIRELFECPVQINVDLDLDYQAKRQWDFVSPKNGESLSSFFDVSFLPRVRDASECLRLIETAVDLGSVLHSAADKHEVSTPEVFVALQRTLVLKRSLLLILKNLFILGTSVIQPDVAKDLLRRISEPVSVQ